MINYTFLKEVFMSTFLLFYFRSQGDRHGVRSSMKCKETDSSLIHSGSGSLQIYNYTIASVVMTFFARPKNMAQASDNLSV